MRDSSGLVLSPADDLAARHRPRRRDEKTCVASMAITDPAAASSKGSGLIGSRAPGERHGERRYTGRFQFTTIGDKRPVEIVLTPDQLAERLRCCE